MREGWDVTVRERLWAAAARTRACEKGEFGQHAWRLHDVDENDIRIRCDLCELGFGVMATDLRDAAEEIDRLKTELQAWTTDA